MKEQTETLIRNSFLKKNLDFKFFPIYEARIKKYYNEIQSNDIDDEQSQVDPKYLDESIQVADNYIDYYVQEFEKGHCEKWSDVYAESMRCGDDEDTAIENAMRILHDEEKRDHEFGIFIKEISSDPIFIGVYRMWIDNCVENARQRAEKYCSKYHELINKGNSEYYAHAYAIHASEENGSPTEACEIYAEAYVNARNNGMNEVEASEYGEFLTGIYYHGYILTREYEFRKKYSESWQKDFYSYLKHKYNLSKNLDSSKE